MGSEYLGPIPDPEATQPRHGPPALAPTEQNRGTTRPHPGEQITPVQYSQTSPGGAQQGGQNAPPAPVPPGVGTAQSNPSPSAPFVPEEPAYREHASGMLPPLAPQAAPPPYAPYPPVYPYMPPQPTQAERSPQTAQPHPGWRPYAPSQPPTPGQPGQPQQPLYGDKPPSPALPPQYYPGYPPMSYPYGYNGQGQPQAPAGSYAQGQAGYAGYPAYPGYAGQPYPYYPYPYYPPGWYPPRPRRDAYQLTISIIALIGAILGLLGGAFCAIILLVLSTGSAPVSGSQLFAGIAIYTALALAGLVGGGFGIYHSIRALLKKSSLTLRLPSAWIFAGLYVALLVFGFTLGTRPEVYNNQALAILLVLLAGIFPAFCFLALAIRRVRSGEEDWPTTWRRFALAITTGATMAILLATIFELLLTFLAASAFHFDLRMIDSQNIQIPNQPGQIIFLMILLAVIAPVVEELAKPLAVGIYAGRMRSAAEAFVLGFAGGVGFDLIETAGYISMQGSQQWVDIAIQRSTAGLLHGFGAGMGALFWYYLINRKSINRRIGMAFACLGYAIAQHAIWNGSTALSLLPDPIGPYLDHGTIPIGSYQMPAVLLVYAVEAALMFAFFLYVTKRLRVGQPPFPTRASQLA